MRIHRKKTWKEDGIHKNNHVLQSSEAMRPMVYYKVFDPQIYPDVSKNANAGPPHSILHHPISSLATILGQSRQSRTAWCFWLIWVYLTRSPQKGGKLLHVWEWGSHLQHGLFLGARNLQLLQDALCQHVGVQGHGLFLHIWASSRHELWSIYPMMSNIRNN